MPAGATCVLPTRPAASSFPSDAIKLTRYNGGEPYFDTVTNFFIDLMAQAFACDVTRFATHGHE